MSYYKLSDNFNYFFKKLNPSPSFTRVAASEWNTIKNLIEDTNGKAAKLSPECFLQGSYKQQTAIYSINDIDIVALCSLWFPGSGMQGSKSYSRDEIFDIVASPLKSDGRYKNKVKYNSSSMCIKIDLSIKVEILPAVYAKGNSDPTIEPFYLYRVKKGKWEQGYARNHQKLLSEKNDIMNTLNHFIPAIKIFKHLRDLNNLDAVSFHIECLLFSLPNELFIGSPSEYLPKILSYISEKSAEDWYGSSLKTPCGEREIFNDDEWNWNNWKKFYESVELWSALASLAENAKEKERAIDYWKDLLGNDFFPRKVSL